MSTAQIPTLDMNKLNAFIGQFVTDLGAAVHSRHGRHWGEVGALQSPRRRPHEFCTTCRQDEDR